MEGEMVTGYKKLSIGFLLLAGLLVSCLQNSTGVPPQNISTSQAPDLILLEEDACSPPCWNMIFPRQSTAEFSQTTLEEAQIRHGGNIVVNELVAEIDWIANDGFHYILTYQDDVISKITFRVNKIDVDLSQVLAKYGAPSFFVVLPGVHPGDQIGIRIYYPSLGVVVDVFPLSAKEIEPRSPVQMISYVTVSEYGWESFYLQYDNSSGLPAVPSLMLPELRVWEGYGKID